MKKDNASKCIGILTLVCMVVMSFKGHAQEFQMEGIKVFEGAGDMEGVGFYSVY